jgi:hypothetical protein
MQRFVHRLSRLLMAIAVIGLALSQTGTRLHAAPFVPSSHEQVAVEHAGQHEHASARDHAHEHATAAHPAEEHPASGKHDHSALGCVVACCIVVSNWSEPASAAECVNFGFTVLYGELAQRGSGQSAAPEPGIPKHLT